MTRARAVAARGGALRQTVDVDAVLDGGALRGLPLLVSICTATILILDGLDVQVIAFAAPDLLKEFGIERAALGPVLSASLIGMRSIAVGLAWLTLSFSGSLLAETNGIPPALEGWQAWVLDGREYVTCPYVDGGDPAQADAHLCAWPGPLDIAATRDAAKLTMKLRVFAPGWEHRCAQGLTLVVLGLIQKTCLGDRLADVANALFERAAAQQVGAIESLIGLLAFSVQIFFDFSSYSDVAIGVALIFGIVLPLNFDAPYQACGIRDFWRRWHMPASFSYIRK